MKKWYIALIIAGLLYLVLLFVLVNNKEENEKYLLFADKILITYEKGKWKKASVAKVSDITIYSGNENLGKFNIKKNEKGYSIYNVENQEYDGYLKNLTGISDQMKMKVLNISSQELNENDLKIVDRVIENYEIPYYSILTASEKITFDFDKDGMEETIYAVSNTFAESEFQDIFSLVFMIEDGKTKVLYEEFGDLDNIYQISRPYFHVVLEDEKSSDLKLVIGLEYFSNAGTRYIMCHSKNDKIVIDFNLK